MKAFAVAAPKQQTAVLKYEVDQNYTREQGVLLAGGEDPRRIEIGQVLGRVRHGTYDAEVIAADGNAGNGVLTLANPKTGAGVKPGEYLISCIAEAENGGTFLVQDPAGKTIAVVTVGGTMDGEICIAGLADGSADFELGDFFIVRVTFTAGVNDGKLAEYDPGASDGREVAYAVALAPATAPADADGRVLVLRRGPAVVVETGLIWLEGVDVGEKAAATAALEQQGILVRQS